MKSLRQPAVYLLILQSISWSVSVSAAPSARLWERWSAHDPDSSLGIDHAAWNDWLERFVSTGSDGINRVDYDAVGEGDLRQLQAYIGSLTARPVSRYNREEQLAYWINLYNALTLEIVLRHYPVDSIRNIGGGFLSSGPWRMKLAVIEGEALTLDDIEHRILRPIWKDPRIHYAVNCASLGCPNLQARAFTSANTEILLEKAAGEFVNHRRGVEVSNGKLRVSSIYAWFAEDFGDSDADVIAHLRQYAGSELLAALASIERISDHAYDWSINRKTDIDTSGITFLTTGIK